MSLNLKEKAVELINSYEIIQDNEEWEIEDAMFGDGSHIITFRQVFDSKKEAKEFVKALKLLYENPS